MALTELMASHIRAADFRLPAKDRRWVENVARSQTRAYPGAMIAAHRMDIVFESAAIAIDEPARVTEDPTQSATWDCAM